MASGRDAVARTRCGTWTGCSRTGTVWVVDADLKAYFDSIPQDRLMARMEERISDGRLLLLLDSFLKQDIMQGLERWTPTAGRRKAR